ncbi:hypothetical protein DQ04_01141100 [Trypanosoma grayi]|uniref:hypothetical protein n=1 Tax=Trypanosoma grayi TaxID=71804 RepID=UPI0004F405F5|nr:hypothetical protein DQ04_01141100 [Trypanosoma grayi]KEG13224.1 hypothetical protein DQ04_01141100 [Trypanosoma grayi]
MNAAENCEFGPFAVINASTSVQCGLGETAGGTASLGDNETMLHGCSVAVHVKFQMKDEVNRPAASQRLDVVENDTYRFSLQLRAFRDSVVHYKGFDQNGYSMCCNFIQGAECSWEGRQQGEDARLKEGAGGGVSGISTRKEPRIVSCPLYHGVARGSTFHGVVTKPLHRLAITEWEARLEFWRGVQQDRELLGRLLLPFRLTEDDVSSLNDAVAAISLTDGHASGALVATENKEVEGAHGDL